MALGVWKEEFLLGVLSVAYCFTLCITLEAHCAEP